MNFKVKQVRTPPLRVGKERKPLGRRAASNIAAEGRTGGPWGAEEAIEFTGEGRMKPSPGLRRDREFYPGRKKRKDSGQVEP